MFEQVFRSLKAFLIFEEVLKVMFVLEVLWEVFCAELLISRFWRRLGRSKEVPGMSSVAPGVSERVL